MTRQPEPSRLPLLATLLLGCGLVLSACDQPKPPPGAAPPAAPAKVRPARTAEPIGWDPAARAFILEGKPLDAAAVWTFDGGTDGFQGAGATLTARPGGGMDVRGDLFDSIIRFPAGLSVKGDGYNAVLVRLTRTRETQRWDGSLFWTTANHGEAAGFATKPIRGADPAVGETTIMVYDLAKPRKGGDDWVKSVITGLRLDLDDDAGGGFTLLQAAIVNIPGGASGPGEAKPQP